MTLADEPSSATLLIQCAPAQITITLRAAQRDDFQRTFESPELSARGQARFVAITTAECVEDWRLLKPSPPRKEATSSSAPKAPKAPLARSTMWQVSVYGLSQTASLPGQPLGLGARYDQRVGSRWGWALDAQLVRGRQETSQGLARGQVLSLGLGAAYTLADEPLWLLARAGARLGAASYDGEAASQDVRVTPFWLPVAGPTLGAQLGWRLWRGLHVSLGLELGWALLGARARFSPTESAGGSSAWGQLEVGVSWAR